MQVTKADTAVRAGAAGTPHPGAFPTSARHGLRWWQVDISYLAIRTMAIVGLAHDIRIPSRDRIAAKRFA